MFGDYEVKTSFSENVFMAYHKPSAQYVAMKKISADNYSNDEFENISEEIKTIFSLSHPNIIKINEAFVASSHINVIYTFYCFGSCKEAMKNFFFTGFSEIVCSLIIKDVLTALDYLHKRGIIHRSIRASHILLNQTHAVITGFRDATSLMTNKGRMKCLHDVPPYSKSINWLAPELLEQNRVGYEEKSDIYSVGITSCELANGIAPFADLSSTLMLTEKIRGNQPSLLDCSTFPSEDIIAQAVDSGIGIGEWALDQTRQIYSSRSLSDTFHKFAEVCMSRYAEHRPTAIQLLNQHAFFKQCKNTTLEAQLKNVLEPVDFDKISSENLAQKSNEDLSTELESLNINETEWDF